MVCVNCSDFSLEFHSVLIAILKCCVCRSRDVTKTRNGEWGMGNEKLWSAVIPKNYAGVCAVRQRDEDCTW